MTAPATTEIVAVPRRHARLGRYTLWQVRDYAVNRGLPTLIVALLIGFLGVSGMHDALASPHGPPTSLVRQYGSVEAARAAWRQQLSVDFVAEVLGIYVFVGALFAMNGVVANDRKFGFYRFLFAKPVTPAAYYGAEFVVCGAAFLALSALVTALWGAIMEPVLSLPLLIAVTAGYLCYAGLGFALSALSRWDWLSLVAVAGAADVLWRLYGSSTSSLAVLLRLLPPVHRTADVYARAANGMALPWHSVLWLAGYGTIAFIAGLAILRHRRLAFN
jgi:hypothetical protein